MGSIKLSSRSVKNYSRDDFIERINAVDWSPVLCNNVDLAWDHFKRLFLKVVDGVAPFKTTRVKQRCEPWMNGDIQDAISERNKAHKVSSRSKRQADFDVFKGLRNKVKKLITDCRRVFFRDKMEEYNKGNPNKLWQSLKLIGYSKKLRTKANNM